MDISREWMMGYFQNSFYGENLNWKSLPLKLQIFDFIRNFERVKVFIIDCWFIQKKYFLTIPDLKKTRRKISITSGKRGIFEFNPLNDYCLEIAFNVYGIRHRNKTHHVSVELYNWLYTLQIGNFLARIGVLGMRLNYIWRWLATSWDLGSVE